MLNSYGSPMKPANRMPEMVARSIHRRCNVEWGAGHPPTFARVLFIQGQAYVHPCLIDEWSDPTTKNLCRKKAQPGPHWGHHRTEWLDLTTPQPGGAIKEGGSQNQCCTHQLP
uniref:Uncharacterized protein n=1 Tax=Eutreptiella gymnastica TaxID=73025 RepID=A0A7S1NGA9_9EUGL